MTAALSHTRPVPRRLLSRNEACQYLGVSPTLFDRGVADGRLPRPLMLYSRKLWDIRVLDLAIDGLSELSDASAADTGWEDADANRTAQGLSKGQAVSAPQGPRQHAPRRRTVQR